MIEQLEAEQARVLEQLRGDRAKVVTLQQSLDESNSESAKLRAELAAAKAAIQDERIELEAKSRAALESANAAAQAELTMLKSEAKQAASQLQSRLAELEKQLEQARLEASNQRAALEREHQSALDLAQSRFQTDKNALVVEVETLKAKANALQAECTAAVAAAAEANEALSKAQAAVAAAVAAAAAASEPTAAAKRPLRSVTRRQPEARQQAVQLTLEPYQPRSVQELCAFSSSVYGVGSQLSQRFVDLVKFADQNSGGGETFTALDTAIVGASQEVIIKQKKLLPAKQASLSAEGITNIVRVSRLARDDDDDIASTQHRCGA